MRILWFSLTPSNYMETCHGGYNGGGWIGALENELRKVKGIELGVAFFMDNQPNQVNRNNVTYFPIKPIKLSLWKKQMANLGGISYMEKKIWPQYEKTFLQIIDIYKPDIIEVFGSESEFGLIANKTNIPVVLHIQGILTPCYNAYLPPFMSWGSYFIGDKNILSFIKKYKERIRWKTNCIREQEILKRTKYFFGRTEWDKRIVNIYNPNATYMYSGELLRPSFYGNYKREIPNELIIISTISSPLYKGYDIILKAASLLKNVIKVDFKWYVFGNVDFNITERNLKICHDKVNVILKGTASAETIRDALLKATVYVHPSYIDNSPNSVCEAQILGCPVIATNVGGTSSLINEGNTGFLVPANDPYQIAYLAYKLHTEKIINTEIGEKAKEEAISRHNIQNILDKMVSDFNMILNTK